MNTVILLSDFDGTIVNIDMGLAVLSKFAEGDWERIEREFASGQITFEESLKREYSMITAPESTILKEMDPLAVVRPYFTETVDYCRRELVPFIITSGGFDFLIRHVMSKKKVDDYVQVYGPRSTCRPEGMQVNFPQLYDQASYCFKDDLVTHYQRSGHHVAYVGDGHADYYALRKADFAFAMKDSPSALRCRKDGATFEEILDFRGVLEALPKIIRR